MVRALEMGFDLGFLRFLSLPGASDLTETGCSCRRAETDGGGGDAMEDSGLMVDVLEFSEHGEGSMGMLTGPATLWQSSSNRFTVSCFTLIGCCAVAAAATGMGGGGGGGATATAAAGLLLISCTDGIMLSTS